MYQYFAWLYVCVPRVCLVPTEVQRGQQIPWNWSREGCKPSCGYWELNQGLLQEGHMPLTANPSLHPCISLFYGGEKQSLDWGNEQGDWSGTLLKKHRLEEKPLDSICEILACTFLMLTSGKPLFLMLERLSLLLGFLPISSLPFSRSPPGEIIPSLTKKSFWLPWGKMVTLNLPLNIELNSAHGSFQKTQAPNSNIAWVPTSSAPTGDIPGNCAAMDRWPVCSHCLEPFLLTWLLWPGWGWKKRW